MNLIRKIAKVVSPRRHRNIWVGMAVVLVGPLVLSSVPLQGDESTKPRPAAEGAPTLAAAEMIFRGAERATVGQRFTLEVLIVNAGNVPLKDLEFHAKLDADIEHASKERDQRVAVEAIAADDLHIVRLNLTPRKSGAGGIDIVLRGKNGATQNVRYVMPIAAEGSTTTQTVPGASPLQVKITSLKECIADRPGIVLINVVNTDSKPMSNKLDLVVSYQMMGREGHELMNGGFGGPGVGGGGKNMGFGGRFRGSISPSNPIRQANLSLPALEPGESHTLPVKLTPRRIGNLIVSVSGKGLPAPPLGAASLSVRFDPNTRFENLLPVRAGAAVPAKLPQTLADVPEVSLEDQHAKALPAEDAFEHVSHLIEKISHVNKTKTDAYMEALIGHRTDVRGLPFTLGDACRLPAERSQHFQTELSKLRQALTNPAAMASQLPNPTAQPEAEAAIKARIAAIVQVVEPEGPQLGRQMVKYLAALSHVDATRALARFAISADDAQVRADAVEALAVRRDKDVSDILTNGLNYPWPAVAEHATEVIVKLKRHDLAPKLIEMLERADPRAPRIAEKDGKKVAVVRELVRINHLRNCLLCHPPAGLVAASAIPTGAVPAVDPIPQSGPVQAFGGQPMLAANRPLTAPVPLPNQALPTPTPQGGYGHFTVPDTLLSFDVTYLRQDFSVKLPVAAAQPWPELQRFDFLVRTRELSEKDARAYRELLRPAAAGELSPYQRAAVTALRQLTGRDAEPTAAAWRQVLAQAKAETK